MSRVSSRLGGFFGLTGTSVGGGKLRYDGGFVGLGSIGYGLGNGLRFELEGNYRQNELSRWNGTPFPANPHGKSETYGAMVNALYDFDLGYPVMPYVGVGVGYVWTSFKGFSNTGINFPYIAKTNDVQGAFAYQAMLGVSYAIQQVPGLYLTAEYRFLGTAGTQNYKGSIITGRTAFTPPTFTPGSFKADPQYNHAGLLGIRYAFYTPPPPPPPPVVAPAPAPARSYLVFFDWDKATLTDRARQIIHEAAENSTRVQYTRIEVNGYTDTSGTRRTTSGSRFAARRRSQPSSFAMACRVRRSRSRASAKRICSCRRPTACVSRRTAASRSSSADNGFSDCGSGRRKAPRFSLYRRGALAGRTFVAKTATGSRKPPAKQSLRLRLPHWR